MRFAFDLSRLRCFPVLMHAPPPPAPAAGNGGNGWRKAAPVGGGMRQPTQFMVDDALHDWNGSDEWNARLDADHYIQARNSACILRLFLELVENGHVFPKSLKRRMFWWTRSKTRKKKRGLISYRHAKKGNMVGSVWLILNARLGRRSLHSDGRGGQHGQLVRARGARGGALGCHLRGGGKQPGGA
jgi:hypothetical protein